MAPPDVDRSVTLHAQLPATVESVAAARHAIRRFAADLEVDIDDLVLAVSEAVANVVVHAYGGRAGTVELTATAAPSELAVVVRDRGRGLEGDGGTSGAGYGLSIIRRLAQHVEVDDSGEGVTMTMRFARAGSS